MSKPKDAQCKCSGLDPTCPYCEGTGKIPIKENWVNSNYMFNVPVDPKRPFWKRHPNTHVTCALCKRRIKRRKFNKHLAEEHRNYDSDKGEIISFTE